MTPQSAVPGGQQKLLRFEGTKKQGLRAARYEHPYIVRLTHWLSAIAILVMILSGIEIFRAFPSFAGKVPENDLVALPNWLGLGGWLGGALEWHLTFMWPLIATGIVYLGYQALSGNYRQVLFSSSDLRGVWPMVRHYFLFGAKPELKQSYNPLQKLAYTTAIALGTLAVVTGLALYKPVQLSELVWVLGGFPLVRMWHFAAMLGLVSFIPGHLVMVALHGRSNFNSMLTGWKKDSATFAPPSVEARIGDAPNACAASARGVATGSITADTDLLSLTRTGSNLIPGFRSPSLPPSRVDASQTPGSR